MDQYAADFYGARAGALEENPLHIPQTIYPRVVRGGSYIDDADSLRSAARDKSSPEWKRSDPQLPPSVWWHCDAPYFGFRIVRPLVRPSQEELVAKWDKQEPADERTRDMPHLLPEAKLAATIGERWAQRAEKFPRLQFTIQRTETGADGTKPLLDTIKIALSGEFMRIDYLQDNQDRTRTMILDSAGSDISSNTENVETVLRAVQPLLLVYRPGSQLCHFNLNEFQLEDRWDKFGMKLSRVEKGTARKRYVWLVNSGDSPVKRIQTRVLNDHAGQVINELTVYYQRRRNWGAFPSSWRSIRSTRSGEIISQTTVDVVSSSSNPEFAENYFDRSTND